MNIKYKLKESGYLVIMREFQNILQVENLTFSLLGSYLCFVLQADWDKRHERYRAVLADDKDLSKLWRCDISTVCRNRKRLLTIGLLEKVENITYVTNLSMFQVATAKALMKKKLTNLQSFYAKSEDELAKSLLDIE